MSAELIPHTEAEAARGHFERYGHVGLTGLIDMAALELAIRQADALALRPHPRRHGEQVSTLRRAPEAKGQPDLHKVLLGIEEGAAMLGRDITPSSRGEKPLIQIIRMEKGTQGPPHRDGDQLADVVAITNLEGRSGLWFEEDGATYTVGTGEVVIHDLRRGLRHQGFTTAEDTRTGLAVAKLRKTGLFRR